MEILSVHDEAFCVYGRVWADAPATLTDPVLRALSEHTPLPAGTGYVASEPALEGLDVAPALKQLLYGGRPAQLGWCNGHNTKLNCLEYHRSSEFNLGTEDFVLLLAKQEKIRGGVLDTTRVRAFRVPAGVLVEVYATTLHYAPCHADASRGFRVLVALPEGTNGPLPERGALRSAGAAGSGDAPLLWAADKWLLAHPESAEAAVGAHVGLTGANIDIARDITL